MTIIEPEKKELTEENIDFLTGKVFDGCNKIISKHPTSPRNPHYDLGNFKTDIRQMIKTAFGAPQGPNQHSMDIGSEKA